MRALALAALLACAACGTGQIFGPGSSVPPDANRILQCVSDDTILNHVSNPAQIVADCGKDVVQTVLDAIIFLIDGGKVPFVVAQPLSASLPAYAAGVGAHAR